MKKLILSTAIFAAFASTSAAFAAEAESPHSFSGNLTVASDYRFRGISQTFKQPTVQGGFDYAHSSGFYVGNWNSNVSGNQYSGGAGMEMDFYTGFKFEPVKDFTADVGVLHYYYPGASIGTTGVKYNNTEVYLGVGYKWISAKYSHGVTDFFGLKASTAPVAANGGSKGSGYFEVNASFDIADKTTLSLHAGHQTVKNYGALSYSDYKIGISRDFGFATIGLAAITTDADKPLYTATNTAGESKKLGTATAVLSISKSF